MKICFALLYYDASLAEPDRFLAHARLIRHLPQEVARLGHAVHVVVSFPSEHRFDEGGVHYHFVPPASIVQHIAHGLGRLLDRQPGSLAPALAAVRTIDGLQPDVVHFHGTNVHLNLSLLLSRLRPPTPPIVLHYHGGFPSRNWLARRLQRRNLGRMTRLLFTTSDHARPFVEAGMIDESRVVELMETSTTFQRRSREACRRRTGMAGSPVFLWAGRLDPIKDPLTALRGFERALASWPQASLYLHYLEDDLLPELERYVEARPALRDRVRFRGRVALERMEEIFNGVDFLLQSSLREFSGYAVLEALACGVLPVVTDIPAFRAMTGGGRHGVLFPPGDAEALARAVTAVPLHEIPVRSRQARAWFESSFSFPALARQLDGLYRSVAAGGDPSPDGRVGTSAEGTDDRGPAPDSRAAPNRPLGADRDRAPRRRGAGVEA